MNGQKLLGTERFEDVFLPEIYELLNDEESYVRVEAIEAIVEVLEHIDSSKIEQEFIPNFLKALVFQNNHNEIIARMAKMLGKIAYKLSFFELHLKYKSEILGFYKQIVNGNDDENMLAGIYNLPCMQQLYKAVCQPPQVPPGTAITQSTGITIS